MNQEETLQEFIERGIQIVELDIFDFHVLYDDDIDQYNDWKYEMIRYLHIHFSGDENVLQIEEKLDICEHKNGALEYVKEVISILKAMQKYASIVKTNRTEDDNKEIDSTKSDTTPIINNIAINNTQSQQQTQIINSIESVLTKEQFEEIKSIMDNTSDKKDKKAEILSKLKEFGVEVCANVAANIITGFLLR